MFRRPNRTAPAPASLLAEPRSSPLLADGAAGVGPVFIDCDAAPYVPKGWSVASHRRAGLLDWRAALADPALAAGEGHATRNLNANVLDHLLAHQEVIPAAWKNGPRGGIRYVFFGGTLYRNVGGRLCVRYLCWIGQWQWMTLWLGADSCCFIPAALRTG